MSKVTIYIAAHKPVMLPTNEPCYHILQVGAASTSSRFGEYHDNDGDNISSQNQVYCELTGYYWMMRNAPHCDYIGIMHYRRFLGKKKYALNSESNILSEADILNLMRHADFVVPTPIKKKGRLNGLFKSDAELGRDRSYRLVSRSVAVECPEYMSDVDEVFKSKTMFFGNIMIASRRNFMDYAKWLFTLERRIVALIEEDGGQVLPRELGYLSEWLLNIYLIHNKQFRVTYLPVHFTEKRNDLRYSAKIVAERLGVLPLLAGT